MNVLQNIFYKVCDLPFFLLGMPYSIIFGYNFTDTPEQIAEKVRLQRIKDGLPEVEEATKHPRVSAGWKEFVRLVKSAFCIYIYVGILFTLTSHHFHI